MTKKRWFLLIAVAAIIIIAIIYGFMPKPVPVDIADTRRGEMKVTIEEEGRTRVKDKFIVSSPVSGFMRRIHLDVGDSVKKGQVVVELEPLRSDVLDPRSYAAAKAAVSAAEAALNAARQNVQAKAAEAEYAATNSERIKKLYEEGYASRNMMEQTVSEAKRTEANRLHAIASENTAHYELEKALTALRHEAGESIGQSRLVQVRSPVNGRILNIHRKSAGVIRAGDPLISIGDPGLLEVTVEALSSDAVKITAGMQALLERWGSEPPLVGKVRVVEPGGFTKVSSLGVEEQRVLVIIDISSPPEEWSLLGDGYRMDVRFIIWEGSDILQVPASALFRKIDSWAVFVEKKSRAYERKVTVGHRTGLAAEITSGLTEGERVILHPNEFVKDGIRVKQR